MEALPKTVYGGPPKVGTIINKEISKNKSFVPCNICRNYKNINDRFHRSSKVHQRKLTERFRIIRSQIKGINLESLSVHDEEWGKEDKMYCYFCSESVAKHKVHDEVMIEFLGYLNHLADPQHKESIKSYLKFHDRKDKWQQFSKASFELENFIAKIPDAKALYLKKLEILNQNDVKKIKEAEFYRQNLVDEARQLNSSNEILNASQHNKLIKPTGSSVQNTKPIARGNMDEKCKVPPWLTNDTETGNDKKQEVNKPIIGPTIETLQKHVYKQKKKGLPTKLLTGNFKPGSSFSKTWLPAFGGIWNKGRHRKKYKKVSKAKRK